MISIIVAIYNIESYLTECLDSIKNQTYQNIEVILVDDGSKDKSGVICDKYTSTDKRFKVFHMENRGLAHARKIGFEKSQGEYVSFIDGDDWLESDYCMKLLDGIRQNNADIAICDFFNDNAPANQWTSSLMIGGNMIFAEYLSGGVYNRMWNKLYRRGVVEKTKFSIGRDQLEDGFWMPQALEGSSIVVRLADCLYHYRTRNDSLLKKGKDDKEVSDIMLNQIYRLGFLCKSHKKIERSKLQTEYINQIETNILLGYDMDKYNVLNEMRNITLKYRDILEENADLFLKKLIECIVYAKDTKCLYLKYWKLIFSSIDKRKNALIEIMECLKFLIRVQKNKRNYG